MKETRNTVKMRDFTRGRSRTAKGWRTASVSHWKKEKGISCRTERTVEKEQEGRFKGGKSKKNVDEKAGICFLNSVRSLDNVHEKILHCRSSLGESSKHSAFRGGAAENALRS